MGDKAWRLTMDRVADDRAFTDGLIEQINARHRERIQHAEREREEDVRQALAAIDRRPGFSVRQYGVAGRGWHVDRDGEVHLHFQGPMYDTRTGEMIDREAVPHD